jgi:hypothetical protein
MDNDLHKPAIGLPSTLSSSKRDIEARIALGPPTSAEDYLLRVRLEADTMPNVFRATPEQLAKMRALSASGQGSAGGATVTGGSRVEGASAPVKANAVPASTVAPGAGAAGSNSGQSQRMWVPTSEGFRISESLRIPRCPAACEPSAAWAAGQLKNFADLRQYLNFWAAHYQAGTLIEAARSQEQPRHGRRDDRASNSAQNDAEKDEGETIRCRKNEAGQPPSIDQSRLPGKADERGWMLKCVGSHYNAETGALETAMAADAVGRRGTNCGRDGEASVVAQPAATPTPTPTPPTVGLLVRLDNVTCARVLEYHVRAVTEPVESCEGGAAPAVAAAAGVAMSVGTALTDCRAVWIYALLARIDRPVPSSTAGYIRDLLRLAATVRQQRAEITPVGAHAGGTGDEHCAGLATLNLLILVARDYFGQTSGDAR